MSCTNWTTWALPILLLVPSAGEGQDRTRPTLYEGSAVVRVEENEYTVRILCNDASRPELGFTTEANRLTRKATGRSNMVGLKLRPWKDTGDVIITLNRYVAWMPQPTAMGGTLSITLNMSPVSQIKDHMPVLLTYDRWTNGDRPPGVTGVEFEARCVDRDPKAPAFRQLRKASKP